jgi:hypothetical protein
MPQKNDMYIANLAFYLNYGDGSSPDEVEYEILKVAFQQKGTVHYDRAYGGGFQDLEQEPNSEAAFLTFGSNFVEAIYIVNAEKGFDPYIIIGFTDIEGGEVENEYIVNVNYRMLKDLTQTGTVQL